MTRIIALSTFIILLVTNRADAQAIEHMEPPFWWVGMANPELQIMLHGEEISKFDVTIDYPGISLLRTSLCASDNYLFVDIHIDPQVQPGSFLIELQASDGDELAVAYDLKERKPGSAMREGFSSEDVVYLITPDRFANGDMENDVIENMRETIVDRSEPYGRHGGDLAGIIAHLDFIEEMGYTALWLNPVLENDQDRWSYHGYATTNYYRVDPRFGSNQDYLRLSELASGRGIKLIMDMIANHCGSGHWWMEDLPCGDWLNFQDSFRITNHRKTVTFDPYASASDKKLLEDGWFVPRMPDLNQRNPFVAKYIIQNSIWWIEYANLGGIRQDTYPYADEEFMSAWACAIMTEYPNFNIVGEIWEYNPVVIAHWQQDPDGPPTTCLRSIMDFPLQGALIKGLTVKAGWERGLTGLYSALVNDAIYPDTKNMMIFGDNHDMSRIFTQLDEDVESYKMAMVYLLTMRGIPKIFYGTEILMSNKGTDSHGVIRSDFPGGWPGDTVNAFSGNGLTEEQQDAKEFVRNMLNWRKSAEVIHHGKLLHFEPKDGVYCYLRFNDEQSILVALNSSNSPVDVDLSRFAEIIPSAIQGYDVINDRDVRYSGTMTVPARSPMVIALVDEITD